MLTYQTGSTNIPCLIWHVDAKPRNVHRARAQPQGESLALVGNSGFKWYYYHAPLLSHDFG